MLWKTTYAAAEEMHRHWIGVELGDCGPIISRLRGEPANVLPKNLGDAAKGMAQKRRQRKTPSLPAQVVQSALALF